MTRQFLIAFGLLTALLAPGETPAQSSVPMPDIKIEQHLNEQVPLDLVFRNEAGREVALQEYFGTKPVILVLAYYRCPRLCSQTLNNLTESLRRIDYSIGKEFNVVTVSFDPREKPDLAAAKKEAYIDLYGRPGAAQGWHFLCGEEVPIKSLASAVGFGYSYDAKTDQYAHASGIMILTPSGKIARYFFGVEYSPRDLGFGLEDASAGRIANPVSWALRMPCFAYDPDTGKYSFQIMLLVRLAGLLTVLILAGFFFRAYWTRRKLDKVTR